jgi:hypothetical protein
MRIGALVGAAAALVAIGLGTTMLIRTPASPPTTGPTAERITVTPSIPLSAPQIVALTHQRPDYGALTDPQRRASCLAGLGYPTSTQILGARPIQASGEPGLLLVLAGDHPGELVALLVRPNCSAADSGLIADTAVRLA